MSNSAPKPPIPARTSGRSVRFANGLMRSTSASPASISTPACAYESGPVEEERMGGMKALGCAAIERTARRTVQCGVWEPGVILQMTKPDSRTPGPGDADAEAPALLSAEVRPHSSAASPRRPLTLRHYVWIMGAAVVTIAMLHFLGDVLTPFLVGT